MGQSQPMSHKILPSKMQQNSKLCQPKTSKEPLPSPHSQQQQKADFKSCQSDIDSCASSEKFLVFGHLSFDYSLFKKYKDKLLIFFGMFFVSLIFLFLILFNSPEPSSSVLVKNKFHHLNADILPDPVNQEPFCCTKPISTASSTATGIVSTYHTSETNFHKETKSEQRQRENIGKELSLNRSITEKMQQKKKVLYANIKKNNKRCKKNINHYIQ